MNIRLQLIDESRGSSEVQLYLKETELYDENGVLFAIESAAENISYSSNYVLLTKTRWLVS